MERLPDGSRFFCEKRSHPATAKIRFSWPADEPYEGVLQVFNLLGQLLATYWVPCLQATFELPAGKLAAGTYIVSLTQGKQQQTMRFMKE